MRRGTTPTVTVHVDADLTGCRYRVAFKSGIELVVKDQDDCELSEDGHTISVPLTQQDTLRFNAGYALQVQVRFSKDGKACATDIARSSVEQILDEEVM